MYILAPYVNVLIRTLDKTSLKRLIISLIGVFSILQTIVILFEELIAKEVVSGASPIGLIGGSERGRGIIQFVIMYLIGAYVRLYGIPKIQQKKKRKLFLEILLTAGVITLWSILIEPFILFELSSAWMYYNPFVMIEAVLIMCLALKFDFKSKIINEVSKCTFTMLIVQAMVIRTVPFRLSNYVDCNIIKVIGMLLGVVLFDLVLSYIAYKIYSFVMKPISRWASNLKIFKRYEV